MACYSDSEKEDDDQNSWSCMHGWNSIWLRSLGWTFWAFTDQIMKGASVSICVWGTVLQRYSFPFTIRYNWKEGLTLDPPSTRARLTNWLCPPNRAYLIMMAAVFPDRISLENRLVCKWRLLLICGSFWLQTLARNYQRKRQNRCVLIQSNQLALNFCFLQGRMK